MSIYYMQKIYQILILDFNNFYNEATINGSVGSTNFSCTFNPIDKIVELYEENKKLLERLLEAEKEKNEILKSKNS